MITEIEAVSASDQRLGSVERTPSGNRPRLVKATGDCAGLVLSLGWFWST